MTKAECDKIWEDIFARHVALVRMEAPSHDFLKLDAVHERECDCISIVLKHSGYDIASSCVYGGIQQSSLSSDWRHRLLNFEKYSRHSSSQVEHTTDNREVRSSNLLAATSGCLAEKV
jgi:hypothetical protein